jgi:hypothetical protein
MARRYVARLIDNQNAPVRRWKKGYKMTDGSHVEITVEEYRRMTRIANAAAWCLGYCLGSETVDKSEEELRGTIKTIKGHLDSAMADHTGEHNAD